MAGQRILGSDVSEVRGLRRFRPSGDSRGICPVRTRKLSFKFSIGTSAWLIVTRSYHSGRKRLNLRDEWKAVVDPTRRNTKLAREGQVTGH
jgi:hypothetical protein